MSKALDRKLDGVYFRVERGGKFESVCFSDLTERQMREVMDGRDEAWLREMCIILSRTVRRIGDELDIVCDDAE